MAEDISNVYNIPWNTEINLPVYVEDLIALFDVAIKIKNPTRPDEGTVEVVSKKDTNDLVPMFDNSVEKLVQETNQILQSEDFRDWLLELQHILGREASFEIGQSTLIILYKDCIDERLWPYYRMPDDREVMSKVIMDKYREIPKRPALPKLQVGSPSSEHYNPSFKD